MGPVLADCAKSFFVDKLFVGIDGFTPDAGFLGNDVSRAAAVRALAGQAQQTIVLSESQKFPRLASVRVLPTKAVSAVFTDEGLDPGMSLQLHEAGVRVRCTPLG